MTAHQEWPDDGWILIGIDHEIVSVAPVETFSNDRHTLGDTADKPDRRRVDAPAASDAGASAVNLRFLRVATGHATALVAEIAGERGGVAMQTGAFPAGAKMGDAIGNDEILRIKQRSFTHVTSC